MIKNTLQIKQKEDPRKKNNYFFIKKQIHKLIMKAMYYLFVLLVQIYANLIVPFMVLWYLKIYDNLKSM